jgi:hypothetical protein
MDSTALLREWLGSYLPQVQVVTQVPVSWTGKLVSIERTGGKIDAFSDSPTFAVQAWAPSKAEAAGLAQQAAAAIDGWPQVAPEVADARVESMYDFADPDSRSQRFQLTVHAVLFNTAQPTAAPPPPPPPMDWDHL